MRKIIDLTFFRLAVVAYTTYIFHYITILVTILIVSVYVGLRSDHSISSDINGLLWVLFPLFGYSLWITFLSFAEGISVPNKLCVKSPRETDSFNELLVGGSGIILIVFTFYGCLFVLPTAWAILTAIGITIMYGAAFVGGVIVGGEIAESFDFSDQFVEGMEKKLAV